MSNDYIIREQNPKRKNFTMLPNILSKIGLTGNERSVYWAIKECAGENSSCTKAQPNLCEMAGVGPTCLKVTIAKLCLVNKFIKKPLIQVVHRVLETKVKNTNEIIVTDIWDCDNEIKEKFYQSLNDSYKSLNAGGVSRLTTEGESLNDYNKEPITNTDKKQQHKDPVSAVVFSCFDKINDPSIDQKEKAILSKKYDEQRCKDAIEVVMASEFMIQTSLLKSLRAACKNGWKPLPSKEDYTEINKKYAEEFKKQHEGVYQIVISNKQLEVIKGITGITEVVLYDIPPDKFKNKLNEIFKLN